MAQLGWSTGRVSRVAARRTDGRFDATASIDIGHDQATSSIHRIVDTTCTSRNSYHTIVASLATFEPCRAKHVRLGQGKFAALLRRSPAKGGGE